MKRFIILSALLSLILITVTSCGSKKHEKETSDKEKDTIKTEQRYDSARTQVDAKADPALDKQALVDEVEKEALARKLVTTPRIDFVDNNYALLKKLCTNNALRSLANEYEYDKLPGEEAYSVWSFDCGCQDAGLISVMSITKMSDDTYMVKGIDKNGCGEFMRIFTFVKEDGIWKLDSYK